MTLRENAAVLETYLHNIRNIEEIINGFHIPDYVKIAAIKAEKEAQENEN